MSYHKIIAAMRELVALPLIWETRCGRGDANQIYLVKMEHTATAASAPFVETNELEDILAQCDMELFTPDSAAGNTPG